MDQTWYRRIISRQVIFHPLTVLATSVAAAIVFVWLMLALPRFAGEGRFYLFYYHAPIGVAFVAYLFDRAERWRQMYWGQWIVELPVLALALARTMVRVPFVSGHALFLSYALLTVRSRTARWIAAIVLMDVVYIKACVLQDVTLIGGTMIGMLAALLVNNLRPCAR